jgi:hypothetical protein
MLRKRIRESRYPTMARNRALHYLAGSYKLSDDLRHELTQARQESSSMLDLFIGFVVGCAVGYVAREMLLRYRRERVRRERVEGRHGL